MDMTIVVANGKYSFLLACKNGGFWIRGDLMRDYFIYHYLVANRETLFASTNPQLQKAKVHSQFNHGSRKTGQAAGAGGLKQDRYVHICDIRPRICGLRLSVSDLVC
jgi:hypothetical protein